MLKSRYVTIALFVAVVLAVGCVSSEIASNNTKAAPNELSRSEEQMQQQKQPFFQNLASDFEMPVDDAGKLLLREYGAVFVARGGATPPHKVVFMDEEDVLAFQRRAGSKSARFGSANVTLQPAALDALVAAANKARAQKLSITPRGSDSARRGYNQTVTLWGSRVGPGLAHWQARGKLTKQEADAIRAMTAFEQVPVILGLESKGLYFAKSLDKSIIYSVAPPGTSQHLAMLAFDVAEFNNPRVRAILNEHGWFQTVVSDLPHFTYIGVSEEELPALGLKKIVNSGRTFWVPDI
ncbi:MAG: hypothetical protein IPM50_01300 [Acidobacteriota bacterium]|nr:MAG: hypothetical protein IPM50_01300 [Acidobacteriota bacterium]